MRTTRLILPSAIVLLAVVGLVWGQARQPGAYPVPTRIVTELTGDQAPGAVATRAIGKVYFDVRSDGTLHYKVDITGLDNITGVYIQEGGLRQDGPVIAQLYLPEQPTGLVRGTLVEGTVSDANLAGPLQGQSVSSLIDRLMSNQVNVNVTTTRWPTGELRGHIPYPYN